MLYKKWYNLPTSFYHVQQVDVYVKKYMVTLYKLWWLMDKDLSSAWCKDIINLSVSSCVIYIILHSLIHRDTTTSRSDISKTVRALFPTKRIRTVRFLCIPSPHVFLDVVPEDMYISNYCATFLTELIWHFIFQFLLHWSRNIKHVSCQKLSLHNKDYPLFVRK